MDSIILKIPADNKYICTVRLAISSIASLIDMDIETIEDLKVSISETMNLLVNKHDDLEFKVNLYDEKIEIEVITEKEHCNFRECEENKFSVMILESLVDTVEFRSKSIYFIKNKG